ncbi:hypothetical protein FRX31_023165 [Thalictrum thalictroides]|uniref:Uncharacterized protein n=1 Tax=Thalictrum thalictroides TaxID=46969 RepID=A0A7J6VQ81_THATH|nr:hypothetical protein FRX31_023165 [Thalictrum thalictroides]
MVVARQQKVQGLFEMRDGTFPDRYLGVPLVQGRLKKSHFTCLLDKIRKKVNAWPGDSQFAVFMRAKFCNADGELISYYKKSSQWAGLRHSVLTMMRENSWAIGKLQFAGSFMKDIWHVGVIAVMVEFWKGRNDIAFNDGKLDVHRMQGKVRKWIRISGFLSTGAVMNVGRWRTVLARLHIPINLPRAPNIGPCNHLL